MATITITVELLGPLRKHLPKGQDSARVSLGAGCTVGDALHAIGVPDEEPWSASIAGQLVEPPYVLGEGDRLLVFAPIEGGCGRPREDC
jgi:sulfur carrier protein ThiS